MAKEPKPTLPTWDPKSIGPRLIQARQALGLTQSEVADAAGIGRNTYNQWETGAERPSLGLALKLCDTVGLTLDWIFRGDPSGLPFRIASSLQLKAS